jgi:autotransporter-associated beta strand protein
MANLYWDVDGDSSGSLGGTGNWDTSTFNWRNQILEGWSTSSSMPTARRFHTSTLLNTGKILVAGGQTTGGLGVNTAEIYDPSTNTWASTGNMVSARFGHSAILLPDGRVFVAGAYNSGGAYLQTAEIYDPSTGTWTSVGSYTVVRIDFPIVLLNGKVFIIAGYRGSGYTSIVETFDPSTNTWGLAGNVNTYRAQHTATVLNNGKILITGGTLTGTTATSSCELYDPITNTWTTTGSLATARYNHKAVLLDSGKVLVSGGSNTGYLSSAEIYDPSTGLWSSAGSFSGTRSNHTANKLPNGKVIVAGGYNGAYPVSSVIYDPTANSWTTGSSLNGARHQHTSVSLNDGRVIIIGGHNNTYMNSVETYNFETINILSSWANTGNNIAYFSSTVGTITLAENISIGGIFSDQDGFILNTTGSNVIILTTNSTFNVATGTLTLNSPISGSFNFTKAGSGVLNLSPDNNYTGSTSLNDGNIIVSSIKTLATPSSLGAPTTLANGTIALGAVTNPVALQYTGSGDTTDRVLNLANTTGNVVITQAGTGLLKFTSNLTATGAGSKNFILDGSTAGTGEISGVIVNNSATNLTRLVKNGTGTWILSGNNTFTGPVTINGGNLIITLLSAGGVAGSLGAAANNAANLVINGGYLNYSSSVTANLTRSLTIGTPGGGFSATGSAPMHINSVITLAGTNTSRVVNFITNNSIMHFSSVLGDNGTGKTLININGSAAFNVQGNNTFTGNITVNNTGGLTLDTNGRLGGGNYTGTLSLNGSTLGVNSSLDQIISGNITGIGSLSKTNTSKFILTGTNNYSSGITLSAGNLVLGSSSALGSGVLTVSGGAIDTLASNIAITNGLNLGSNLTFWGTGNLTQSAGDISLTNSNTTVHVAARALKLAGNISGSSNLVKIGAGNLSKLEDPEILPANFNALAAT